MIDAFNQFVAFIKMIKIGQAFTIKKNYNVIKEWKKISLSNYKHKAAFNLNSTYSLI